VTPTVPVCTVRQWPVPAGRVVARSTAAAAGDFRVDGDARALARRRVALAPGPWTWLRQVHGADVIEVAEPGEGAGRSADAAVTVTPGCVLAVTTADCAPLVLVAEAGLAVVHAGWRGAEAGVIAAAAGGLARLGAGAPVASWLGPCIGPASYEFGEEGGTSPARPPWRGWRPFRRERPTGGARPG
jgi:copper oxidase (laccase) domain-containing protein